MLVLVFGQTITTETVISNVFLLCARKPSEDLTYINTFDITSMPQPMVFNFAGH